jgi:hypothetical protein
MPHGSGMETRVAEAEKAIRQAFPQADLRHLVREHGYMADDPRQRAEIAAAGASCVVYFGSPTGALNLVGARYCAALEQVDVPTLLVIPGFAEAAIIHNAAVRRSPLSYILSDSGGFADGLVHALLRDPEPPPPAERHEPAAAALNEREAMSLVEREGWGDGLPLVLPTRDRVDAMLAGFAIEADELIADELGPHGRRCTARILAANAVLAGARACDLPLLAAAVRAFAENPAARPMLSSVNSFCFALRVRGPVRRELGLQAGFNSMGAVEHRAIERALALVLQNVLGVRPGLSSFQVQGVPMRPVFLIVDNEEADPWQEAPARSSVTLYGGGWSHLGTYFYPDEGLDLFAAALARLEMPHSALVLLSPERARLLASRFAKKTDLAEAIRQQALIDMGNFRASGYYPGRIRDRILNEGTWPRDYLNLPDDALVPAYPPGGIQIAVVGGEGAPVMTAWKFEHLADADLDLSR